MSPADLIVRLCGLPCPIVSLPCVDCRFPVDHLVFADLPAVGGVVIEPLHRVHPFAALLAVGCHLIEGWRLKNLPGGFWIRGRWIDRFDRLVRTFFFNFYFYFYFYFVGD